jgi:replicative DNA helicase
MQSDTVIPSRVTDERAVLAYLLMDGGAGYYHQTGLKPDSFHVPAHRKIWQAIEKRLSAPGAGVDATMVISMLSGDREAISHVSSCLDGAVRSERIAFWHAARVRESAEMRAVMLLGQKLTDTASNPEADRGEIIGLIEKSLANLYAGTENAGCDPAAIVSRVVELALSQRKAEGVIGTGIIAVNHLLNGGLHPGRLYIGAGRPGSGKSILGLQAMDAAVQHGMRVNFHSLEMGREEIIQRWLAKRSQISYGDIQSGSVFGANARTLKEAAGWIEQRKNLAQIFDGGDQDCGMIQGEIHRWKPNLVILDYVQLANTDQAERFSKNTSRDREISMITKRLKGMARNYNVPVFAMSQLNREIEKRKGGRPQLSDLRESGGLEADADVVLMIWEPGKTDESRNIERMIRVSKNRNGLTGTVPLFLDGEHMTLTEEDWRTKKNQAVASAA